MRTFWRRITRAVEKEEVQVRDGDFDKFLAELRDSAGDEVKRTARREWGVSILTVIGGLAGLVTGILTAFMDPSPDDRFSTWLFIGLVASMSLYLLVTVLRFAFRSSARTKRREKASRIALTAWSRVSLRRMAGHDG